MAVEITSTCDRCLAVYYLGKLTIADTRIFLRQTNWIVSADFIVCPACSSSDKAAARAFAKVTGKSSKKYRPVYNLTALIVYDYYDATSGNYGKCQIGKNGEWIQPPFGESATILAFRR